jgi:hypothetical protein
LKPIYQNANAIQSPITAYQAVQREIREVQVRDCMKTKGYRIETEVQ